MNTTIVISENELEKKKGTSMDYVIVKTYHFI